MKRPVVIRGNMEDLAALAESGIPHGIEVISVSPGASYGLVSEWLDDDGSHHHIRCNGCLESAEHKVNRGEVIQATLLHNDRCPVLDLMRAMQGGASSKKIRRLLKRAIKYVNRVAAASKN